ncbi:hypothetical protein MRB53_016809 [Persea americana]|uniref:Uncharacterized protein n=1 Tax=Persea americana TaxID=3435 RepID=A0ACC2M3A5_PERAE|nr:hypothetical protein MRB53_016809 [Persea americana]
MRVPVEFPFAVYFFKESESEGKGEKKRRGNRTKREKKSQVEEEEKPTSSRRTPSSWKGETGSNCAAQGPTTLSDSSFH